MVEYVPIPRVQYNWHEVLANIPSGKAVQLHYGSRNKATLAGEAARHYAQYNKLGKLHTRIEGGVLDPISGSYKDVDCEVTLTIWF